MINDFTKTLTGHLRFNTPHLAFCTHYSWFGVVKGERLGIEQLYLFYNRVPAMLSPGLLTFDTTASGTSSAKLKHRRNLPLQIIEEDTAGLTVTTEFTDTDVLCCHVKLDANSRASGARAAFFMPETDPRFTRQVDFDPKSRLLRIETRMPRTDGRDPDIDHPLLVCLIIPEAFNINDASFPTETDGAISIELTASADALTKAEQTFILGIGEGPSVDRIEHRTMRHQRANPQSASAASQEWLRSALDAYNMDRVPQKLREHYAKAAYQLISNTKAPRGQIGRYSAFPSRGVYCAHYLWDACFTSLGVGQFNQRLAEDYLLALCECQESDGKIPQFVCATWNRPGESQPPLIAWAAWRLYERFGNRRLLEDIFDPLCKMADWWFEKRDKDRDGVVEYQHPLESGWDNSPRFDKGRIAAVDLNAFLNREMRTISSIARELGRQTEAAQWEQWSQDHTRNVLSRLYDPEDRLFYDRLVDEDRLNKILTPASFMPLWTQMKLPPGVAQEMIARHLLNPREFFGARPFPVVAYSDPHYEPDRWWRGPVWPNIAWTMIEALKTYGFDHEAEEARRRLLSIMLSGDEMNELYSSATGRPLGAEGLGWSCAVFMELARAAI